MIFCACFVLVCKCCRSLFHFGLVLIGFTGGNENHLENTQTNARRVSHDHARSWVGGEWKGKKNTEGAVF